MVKELSIKVANPDNEVTSLSGGNQQKVVIGKALLTNPKVLLMDEPSRGIDVGAKADVFRTMRKLSRDGLGILFATSDLDEVMALSDRIAVMSNGKLTGMFDREEATEAKVVAASAQGTRADAQLSREQRTWLTLRHGSRGSPSAEARSLLTLMKARTFIALIAVILFFSLDRADLPVDRQPDPDVEARGAERLPGDGHDLRHHHRRHRPFGRLDRRPLRAWLRAIWCSTASTCRSATRSISTCPRSS